MAYSSSNYMGEDAQQEHPSTSPILHDPSVVDLPLPDQRSSVHRPPRPRQVFVQPEEIGFFKSYFAFAENKDIIAVSFAILITICEAFLVLLLPILLFVQPMGSISRSPLPWFYFRDTGALLRFFSENSYYTMLGVYFATIFVLGSLRKWLLDSVRERMESTLKRKYFQAVLRSELAWFDIMNPLTVAGSVATDAKRISEVLAKVGFDGSQECL